MIKSLVFLFLALLSVLVLPFPAVAQTTLQQLVTQVGNAMSLAIGAFVFIAWVITAFLFLTSWGNPERLGTAKKSFIWSAAGTALYILAISAQTIISSAIQGR